MTHRLLFLVLAATPLLVLAREPYRPQTRDAVVLQVPIDEQPSLQALRRLDRERRDTPQSLPPTLAYARKAIEVGRTRVEPRFIGHAEAALRPFSVEPIDPEVRVLRATLAQHRHDFAAALAELDAVLTADPGHAQARLTRAVIHRVQGRPSEALRDCAALQGRSSPLVMATCAASARALLRGPLQALALLDPELERSREAPMSERLWALTVRAELAEGAGAADADDRYREALAATPAPDPYLLFAYADFLLEAGRFPEVRRLLAPHAQLDGALLRLALAERRLLTIDDSVSLRRALAARVVEIEARHHELRLRGEQPHAREAIRFYLEVQPEPITALELAQLNWTLQREPMDAALLLDAARAAAQPAAAAPVLTWMEATGIDDVRLNRRRAGL